MWMLEILCYCAMQHTCAAPTRLTKSLFLQDFQQDALRTPAPATLLPVNMSTIAKPRTFQGADRQEYSPLTKTELAASLDRHANDDRATGLLHAWAPTPGDAGNPKNNFVQADTVATTNLRQSLEQHSDDLRKEDTRNDVYVHHHDLEDRVAYPSYTRMAYSGYQARNSGLSQKEYSGSGMPPHPDSYGSDSGLYTRKISRRNSYSQNPDRSHGNNGYTSSEGPGYESGEGRYESGERRSPERREIRGGHQDIYMAYDRADHDIYDEHPFALSQRAAQLEMYQRHQGMPRYYPPSGTCVYVCACACLRACEQGNLVYRPFVNKFVTFMLSRLPKTTRKTRVCPTDAAPFLLGAR